MRAKIGRVLLTLVALHMAIGTYVFDWNVTHIYNPSWPPHAKFHNGQTMAMAIVLALMSLFFIWRKHGDTKTNLLAGALVLSVYWVTQALANFYPGVAWTDPEFLKPGQTLHDISPQTIMDVVALLLIVLGARLTLRSPQPA